MVSEVVSEMETELKELFEGLEEISFSRESLRKTSELVLALLEEKGITSSGDGLTGRQIVQELTGKASRTSIQRALKKLESLGMIDREMKGYGYYISPGFFKRLEKLQGTWRKLLNKAREGRA